MRSAQLVRSDDGGVEDLRRRKGETDECDHSHLESSTTAQHKNQEERAYHGNNQGSDAPEAVGKECEHYL